MLVENVELTMSHLGLGRLSEFALLVLFANGHSRHLVDGTGLTPDQIKDPSGLILYPAYYKTHLRVPSNMLLSSFKLWDSVDVGVDVRRFGKTLLESKYILGRSGDISADVEDWDFSRFPSMQANSLFVVDAVEENSTSRRVAVPERQSISDLPKLRKPPAAINAARQMRVSGFEMDGGPTMFQSPVPMTHQVESGRDAAAGHTMIFAKFSEIMDLAEARFLSRHLQPGFPAEAINHMVVLEREIYYYSNCFYGDTLDVYLKGNMVKCESDYHGASLELISAALLTFVFEIYEQNSNALLSLAKVKKLIAVPASDQAIIQDVSRLVAYYSKLHVKGERNE